ncbi:MAG TPA: integrase core domain-containing protein [Frankiaceae bacterium]|nr:integrase core domain-containing protein [Frankiaceae bacterium]
MEDPCRGPRRAATFAPPSRCCNHRLRPGSTRPGCSGTGSAPPSCSARWAASPPPSNNTMIESFFNTMQRELLDSQPRWASKADLASAIFEWIEAWYNPRRRHTSIGSISPAQ